MTAAGATLPRVMRDRDVEMHDFPDHANVLAVVHAYVAGEGPMPYALLLSVMESLAALDHEAAIKKSDRSVRLALHGIVSDLRRLDLIDLGSSGTVLTPCGEEQLQEWNGKFRNRSAKAADEMRELGFMP